MHASQTMGSGAPKVREKKIIGYQIHMEAEHDGICLIPALGQWRQEDQKFKSSFKYVVNLRLACAT